MHQYRRFPAGLALFSDDAHVRGWPKTEEIVAELRDLATTTPVSAPAGQRQTLIGPWGVRMLDDGRVAAAVLFTFEHELPFAEATKALFFVQLDGRWLIDEWTETVEIPGCELSVDVEQAVSPPPGVTIESWPTGCDEQFVLPSEKSGAMPHPRNQARRIRSLYF